MRITPPSPSFGHASPKSISRPPSRGISHPLFYGLFAALGATNVVTMVGFLMSPDISRLMSGQAEMVLAAYEDRIAELRIEVDRLHSRQYAQAGDINLQLQELAQQQEMLTEQHQYVRLLAQKADELGIETADLPAPTPAPAPIRAVASVASVDEAPATPGDEIDDAANAVNRMMTETRMALASLSDAATESTETILDELDAIGIRPTLPSGDGVGGPLLPPVDGPETWSMLDDASSVMMALERFKSARDAASLAPIFRPVTSTRMSSGFGNRRDPFTGRRAFHSGLDFPVPTGTTVLSAGDGKVSFAGRRSGYGNVVEITHGDGLVTRYAHLSAILVNEGQEVGAGMPIAKAGSTGRSTGPHLHFEVRRGDRALDPRAFIEAGNRLQRFVA